MTSTHLGNLATPRRSLFSVGIRFPDFRGRISFGHVMAAVFDKAKVRVVIVCNLERGSGGDPDLRKSALRDE
ncbi:hypothetical protein Tco_1249139 [Tanacetum coccineum]